MSSILRCNKHGGMGFVSDCEVCKSEVTQPAAGVEEPGSIAAKRRGGQIDDVVLYIDALRSLLAAEQARGNEFRIQLEAWQKIFHTSQLSHAQARLEAAEQRASRAESELDKLRAGDSVVVSREPTEAMVIAGAKQITAMSALNDTLTAKQVYEAMLHSAQGGQNG